MSGFLKSLDALDLAVGCTYPERSSVKRLESRATGGEIGGTVVSSGDNALPSTWRLHTPYTDTVAADTSAAADYLPKLPIQVSTGKTQPFLYLGSRALDVVCRWKNLSHCYR